jgi:chromatin structure-remodeling complex subunit RSC3/30
MIGPFVMQCCDAIRADVIDSGALKSHSATIAMAEKLVHNTSQKIRITTSTRFKDFLSFYSGPLIRWECLGIFFTCCGLCCNMMTCDEKELEFVGHKETDRQSLMYRLLALGNACVGLCEEAGQLSDLGMWNMIENCVYASQVLGDAHYSVWRKVGDMSTAIFAQGLHQEGNYTPNLPFWLIQMRRHALGTAYSVDKLLCTFVGRPPRISKRYCTIVPPLDLEFYELEYEGDDLDKAISNIDDDGWNRSQRSRKSLYQRCFVLSALIREEVLELSLGPLQEDMMEKSL